MPPPGSYAILLLIIGPGGAAGGAEGEQKITIIFVLLFARLQLRLQLRCVRTESVQYPNNLLLYLQRRNRNRKFGNRRSMNMGDATTFFCIMYFLLNVYHIIVYIFRQ